MIVINSYNGFNIFEPAQEIIPESKAKVDKSIETNRKYLKDLPIEKKSEPIKPITGTFIYAHPPDYTGSYTLNWTSNDWNKAFARLKAQNIDTVILQASVWNELQEVFYPSKMFSHFKYWNVVEPMLESAKLNGMTVFLGGYGSVSGWNLKINDKQVLDEIKFQCDCFSELLRYRESFDGIYYSPETAFNGIRDFKREERLHWIYQTYFKKIKEMAPEKKILMSPASKWIPEKNQEFTEAWLALFEDVPLDILTPQDSIGCSGCTLEVMSDMWKLWRNVADLTGIRLWANIELFERVGFGGAEPFISAAPERIVQQCRTVAPYVEKCICWEALYFDLPKF
jgi:hypothetical protein